MRHGDSFASLADGGDARGGGAAPRPALPSARPLSAEGPSIVPNVQLVLPRAPEAGVLARRAVDELASSLPGEFRSRLRLVVSELVTNAVRHGEGRIELRMWREGSMIRGEVVDQGGGFEREVRRDGWDDVGGRGLGIVERLTRRWGIREGTTHVWFEIDATGPSSPAEPEVG